MKTFEVHYLYPINPFKDIVKIGYVKSTSINGAKNLVLRELHKTLADYKFTAEVIKKVNEII